MLRVIVALRFDYLKFLFLAGKNLFGSFSLDLVARLVSIYSMVVECSVHFRGVQVRIQKRSKI